MIMNKKAYQSPTMNVVEIEVAQMMAASDVRSVNSSSTGVTYGGASRGPARAKNNSVNWDNDWSN